MKQVTINDCRQCKHFNHRAIVPVCFGLGFRARLPHVRFTHADGSVWVRATGRIPTWCSLKEAG